MGYAHICYARLPLMFLAGNLWKEICATTMSFVQNDHIWDDRLVE